MSISSYSLKENKKMQAHAYTLSFVFYHLLTQMSNLKIGHLDLRQQQLPDVNLRKISERGEKVSKSLQKIPHKIISRVIKDTKNKNGKIQERIL